MGITSIYYILFALAVVLIYYIIPKKIRWMFLLLAGVVYMCIMGAPWLMFYPLASITIAWICTCKMSNIRLKAKESGDSEQIKKAEKTTKWLLLVAIAANLGILFVLKYLNLVVYTYNAIALRFGPESKLLEVIHFAVPLGVSFYTMSVLGYIFDVYYEISDAEKNLGKLLLFGSYFPLLISGPIVRYKDVKSELFGVHALTYKNVTYGAQRILWGFFKVLIVSEKLSIVVGKLYCEFDTFPSGYIWIAMWLFAFQLYANFSGSMDIIIGISEIMGIKLPENFRQPFFSQTIQEFWQRWHITLGAWLKDYILYPVLRTKFFMGLPNKWKEKLGKKKAKQYTTFLAMAILWFSVGLWHGGSWKYIWGTGLLQCIYIIISELCTPHWKKVKEKLKIKDEAAWFVLFKRLRTFVLISIGLMFFNSDSLSAGFKMLARAFGVGNGSATYNEGLVGLGLEVIEWHVLAVALLIVLVVSIINEKKGDVRDVIARQNIVIRWSIFYIIILMVVVFGNYGPGYDAADFIYQAF